MSTNKSVAKSASVIGLATFCSRLLGFIRDIIIARLFGIYVYAQAFVIAFRIPNLFRDLVGEGATNSAFVPVFSEYIAKQDKEEFWELANTVLNLILVVVTTIVLLGIAFSPLIVRLIAPGFIQDPFKLETTIKLNRIIFPYLLLISLTAYCMGILNSLKHFTIPAFAPCLLNISIILFALIFGEGVTGLALGILVGGLLQLLVQIPMLYKKGFRLHLFRRFRHPGSTLIMRLMVPRLLSSSIYQLNNFVDSVFGSLVWIVGDGGVAVLYFSYRLIQFPLGIFSNALSQAILPTLSTQAAEDNRDRLKLTLSWGLRATFFVMLPAAFGFMALAFPIISTLFGGGKFDISSVSLTANALFFYSIGLFAYGGTKVLQSCFFALKDTVTPTKVAAAALVINTALNFLLMFPLKTAGLALATSISGIFSFFILFFMLGKKLGDFGIRRIAVSFARISAASICMGIICYIIFPYGACVLKSSKFPALILAISAGFLFYVIFCFIFRVGEMKELGEWVLRSINPKPGRKPGLTG